MFLRNTSNSFFQFSRFPTLLVKKNDIHQLYKKILVNALFYYLSENSTRLSLSTECRNITFTFILSNGVQPCIESNKIFITDFIFILISNIS